MANTRSVQVSRHTVVSQGEAGVESILDGSVELSVLKDEVTRGLLPIGTVVALMPHMAGAFQPGASGIVNEGMILCDGAVIPSGNNLQGNTPNINNSAYLRGATTSSSTLFSSNNRAINTPQMSPHAHPATIATGNAPHSHPITINAVNNNHIHPMSVGSRTATHNHAGTVHGANVLHKHPRTATSNASIATHSHPISLTAANMPHSHAAKANNGFFGPTHVHLQAFFIHAPGPVSNNQPAGSSTNARDDMESPNPPQTLNSRQSPVRSVVNGPATNNFSYNHGHPGGGTNNNNTGTHSHTVSESTTNTPHTHPISMANANMGHSHTINTGTGNAPHSHPGSITSANVPHTHPLSVNAVNIPHNHPGTGTGNTGSTSNINFEPKYVNAIYVIRVS